MSDSSTGKSGVLRGRAGRRLAVVALVVLAGAALLAGTAAAQSGDGQVVAENSTVPEETIESQPAPPETDRLGWENGVWYNATLAIDQSDGIQSGELRALVARTMARTERVRGLEFERTVPVRVISREQAINESSDIAALNESDRLALNAQYEALFLIEESTDALESREALLGGGIGGYYAPSEQAITMVSPEGEELRVKENTLSQELFHAQQDQKFNISGRTETIEERNAFRSVVEGDANYVQYIYEQRCEQAWSDGCYVPEGDSQSQQEPPEDLNIGMVQVFLHPYNSGVAFVRDVHQTQGWDAVDGLYENPPASTEQVIHPEKYPDEKPANLTVEDRSTDEWEPLTADGERLHSTAGEAGLFVSLWYPGYESQSATQIIPYLDHINVNETTGEIAQPVTYQYDHPSTAGWAGDKLLPYVTDNRSIEEMGYVYEMAWDSPAEAEEFDEAYRDLLAYHGAENVSGHANTYRFPEGSGFADAVYVDRSGANITIVNAPTVAELSEIRPDAAPEVDESQPANTDNETDGAEETTMATSTASSTETSETNGTEASGGESGPGFGALAAVLALLALAGLAGLRERGE